MYALDLIFLLSLTVGHQGEDGSTKERVGVLLLRPRG